MALDRRRKRTSLLDRLGGLLRPRSARGTARKASAPKGLGARAQAVVQSVTPGRRSPGRGAKPASTARPTRRFRDLPPVERAQARDRIRQASRRMDPMHGSGGAPGM